MRILYVGNFSGLSVGEPDIARSLETLGHTVIRVPESVQIIELEELIHTQEIHMLLFAKFRVGTPRERKEFLADLSIPSVCWVFDLYWGI